ncbi:MAG: DNRLRE domain-containing protein [bacterium]
MKNQAPTKDQEGFSLLMVMATILMLEIICLFLAQTRGTQATIASNRIEHLKARYLAEAGMAHGLWRIQNDPAWRTDMNNLSLGEGTYTVSFVEDTPQQEIVITSQSIAQGVTLTSRRVLHWLTIQPPSGSDPKEMDTYLEEGSSTAVRDTSTELLLDSESSAGTRRCRTLVRFNLWKYAIPVDASIISSSFSMYLFSPANSADFINKGIVSDTYRIHRVTRDWYDHETCWAYRNKNWGWLWSSPGGDFDVTSEDSCNFSAVGWYTWRIPDMIRYWMKYPDQNYGFIIETDPRSGNNECKFYSSESSQLNYRPRLTIYYLDSRDS